MNNQLAYWTTIISGRIRATTAAQSLTEVQVLIIAARLARLVEDEIAILRENSQI